MPEDKFYVGYFAGDDLSTGTPSEERLTAVLDLILDYPEEKTACIGFFMVDAAMQSIGFARISAQDLPPDEAGLYHKNIQYAMLA